jgi:hypothetical protein
MMVERLKNLAGARKRVRWKNGLAFRAAEELLRAI